MTDRLVLTFDEADPGDVALLGGKGAGLAEMTQRGLPVPPGFIITTAACRHYLEHDALPDGLVEEVMAHLHTLQGVTGKTLGAGPKPLLVSVRSGAPISMPGMMDTILDLGLNAAAAEALGALTGDARFVADVTRRFQSMYSQTVLGALDEPAGVQEFIGGLRADVSPLEAFEQTWLASEESVRQECGETVPSEPEEQLRGAIEAVFRSWNTRRARTYREHHRIPHTLGTAVVVQTMVFGNLGTNSGSGVAFTRNPVDGDPELFGEFLFGGQGEDVVNGQHTPESIQVAAERMPGPFEELLHHGRELEANRGDVLDIEFTVEEGRLYFLQVRSAKRTAQAAVRIADDLWAEGRTEPARALAGVDAAQVRQILRPSFDDGELAAARADGQLVATGTGACPGQVTGLLCFDSDTAKQHADEGADVILARPVTSPADLHGMIAARGIVTAVGGSTSHAAVVARALGTACIVGCAEAQIDPGAGTLTVGDMVLHAGDPVSLDGGSGELFAGELPVGGNGVASASFTRLIERCADASQAQVWGRVTLPSHVERVRAGGGTGVVLGLDDALAASGRLDDLLAELKSDRPLRTDHMSSVEAIVADHLVPVLEAAGELPVGIRAIDFVADEAREYLQQTPLLTARPDLTLPLGVPELVEAQALGVAQAAERVGYDQPLALTIRHVSGIGEAAALAALTGKVRTLHPACDLTLGIYATSAAALTRAGALAKHAPIQWIELRTVQALHHGLPPRMLLTRQPLDGYVDAGLLQLDPRLELDMAIAELLEATTTAGLRLSPPANEALVSDVYRLGYRLFAAEADEVAPLLVCLGKAALNED